MSKDWKKTYIFYRDTNIYTFNSDPLFRKNKTVHAYLPWTNSIDDELMYKLKATLASDKEAYIPLMDIEQNSIDFDVESDFDSFNTQLNKDLYETHLIMCNGESIHIFKVEKVLKKSDISKNINTNQKLFKQNNSKYTNWFVVSDVFVYSVNHINNMHELECNLESLVESNQTQKVFTGRDRLCADAEPGRWIGLNRNLTYEYYIKSRELKDNIYQDMWAFLSHRAQHSLIISELERGKCVLFRGEEKWQHLAESFQSYRNALIIELNELYIVPLKNAISEYQTLADAWEKIRDANINQQSVKPLEDVISKKKESIDTLEDFIELSKSAKSLFFSLKNQFSKKLFMEEHLLVENFLSKNESLFDSFLCRNLNDQVRSIIEIERWITSINPHIASATLEDLRGCNSKLSHIISIMSSASYNDNIFFKLLEEKLGRGTVQKSFIDEVKSLSHISFKKTS